MNKINRILKILEEKYGSNDLIELDYINDYTLLVAVILSAQATDKGVNLATKKLFKIVKTPEEMINLGFEKLNEYIKTINYHNNKAKNIINMSKKLVKNFNSKLPDNMKDLTSLDGVGRKTANIILNIVFKKPAIAVDTHVFRVSHRLGLVPKSCDTPLKVEKELMRNIPLDMVADAHHWLLLHGRYVCTSRAPHCDKCQFESFCPKQMEGSKLE